MIPVGKLVADSGDDSPKVVSVLGATGSVGRIAVDLLEQNKAFFVVDSLVAGGNVVLLAEQARRVGARLAVTADPSSYGALQEALSGTGIESAAGHQAVMDAASRSVDLVLAAIVGVAGLAPTLAAVRVGARIGLANKECLVSAGTLFMSEVRKHSASIIPVDSEHSAIFQALAGTCASSAEKLVLTGSGGPFRNWDIDKMRLARPADALNHPNFTMGQKISIDSATMMNKGFELIEAHYLFDVPLQKISFLVHPEQIIHGFVEFSDRSIIAQLGTPDMATPVAVALSWPSRLSHGSPCLDLCSICSLNFFLPDEKSFPALSVARAAFEAGLGFTCAMNAANEIAVRAFLSGRIDFLDIVRIVSLVLEHFIPDAVSNINDLMEIDCRARHHAESFIIRR